MCKCWQRIQTCLFACVLYYKRVCVSLWEVESRREGGGEWVWRAQCAASVERKVVWYGGRLGPNVGCSVSLRFLLACLSLICLLGNGKVITSLHRETSYPPVAPEHNAYNSTSKAHLTSLYRLPGCLRLFCKWCCRAPMLYFEIQPSLQLLAYNFYLLKFSVALLNWTFH